MIAGTIMISNLESVTINAIRFLPPARGQDKFVLMLKTEILEALPKLSAEERREIRAKLNELDEQDWLDDGDLTEREKAIIEARLRDHESNPEAVSSWEEVKARVVSRLHAK